MGEHYHTHSCIEHQIEDYTDAVGGESYSYYSCTATGETHRYLYEFTIEVSNE